MEFGGMRVIRTLPDDENVDFGQPHYKEIEYRISSREGYGMMRAFTNELAPSREKFALEDALEERKPFRRFKETVGNYPALEQRWYAFQEAAQIRLAEQWLKDEGIDAVIVDPYAPAKAKRREESGLHR